MLVIPILILYLIAVDSLSRKGKFLLGTATTILVFFVGAISLDLEVGSMGLPNFGKVAFFAIGAYVSTLLYSEYNVD
ncbi:MAG: ABC transporter permease subunit, partial [Candidatus Hodarchaeales archaeon]